ncbi:MAG: hypothetical protein H0T91_11925 [Propionibacteriaceae bacterium]|nr:hypothetical protein [Propionibacteriaceae bacterium]
MFVQVFQGKVTDPQQARAALDRWVKDLAPGASGWLGSTTGVTEDGTLVALARFASEEAARANSDRPEQGEWWAETSKLFTGEVTFHESTDVLVDTNGDPDEAGFVQIMQGRSTNPARVQELMKETVSTLAAFRPDILGRVAASYDDGGYTMAIYFTSEEAAREGERKPPPPELQQQLEELQSLDAHVPDFYDLKQPWLDSPT